MHADALTIGQYIKAAEFGVTLPAEPTWTITGAQVEDVPSLKPGAAEGKTVPKGIVFFREIPRGWVMNKTNAECLKALFGAETDGWVGKRVTLHALKVSVGRTTEPGIRVKGSPDIDREVKAVVKLPKRAPQTMTLVPTGQRSAAANGNGGPMDLSRFLQWLDHALTPRGGGWTRAQVDALLGGPPDAVAPERRRDIVARLKSPPPAPIEDDSPPGDEPSVEEREVIAAEERRAAGGR